MTGELFEPRNWLEAQVMITDRWDEYVFGVPNFATHRKTEGLGHSDPPVLYIQGELVTREAI